MNKRGQLMFVIILVGILIIMGIGYLSYRSSDNGGGNMIFNSTNFTNQTNQTNVSGCEEVYLSKNYTTILNNGEEDYSKGQSFCKDLSEQGYDDWRIPFDGLDDDLTTQRASSGDVSKLCRCKLLNSSLYYQSSTPQYDTYFICNDSAKPLTFGDIITVVCVRG
jgi:hypothetical protein